MKHIERNYHIVEKEYDDMYEANIRRERQLPDYRDGMRMVQRRLYWVFLSMSKDRRYNLTKSASVVGDTIKLHPHGDVSIYESLVNEVNSLSNMIRGKGNWGCKASSIPSKPAKMRYTECSLQKEAEGYFYYAPYSEMVMGENNELEPVYLPVPFPLALLGGFFGISKAGRVCVPSYKISDLFKRLQYLIGDKSGKPPIIKPWFGYPLKMEGDFESILTSGAGQVSVYPDLLIDEKDEKITIRAFCPDMTNVGQKLEKLSIHDKFGRYIEITDLSAKKNEIIIEYKTKYMKNVDISFKQLCTYVEKEFTQLNTYKIISYKEYGSYPSISVDTWLLDTYEQILGYREKELNQAVIGLKDKLKLNEAILLARPIIQEALNKYKKFTKEIIQTVKNLVVAVVKDSDITTRVFQMSISRLMDCDIDIDALKNEIKTTELMNTPSERMKFILTWMENLSK